MKSTLEMGFNGIDGATGLYLTSPSVEEIARAVRGEPPHVDDALVAKAAMDETYGLPFDVDPTKLEEAGWGMVFAHDAPPEAYEALKVLRALRAEVAGARYKEFKGVTGYRPGESVTRWLGRQGAAPGVPQVQKVPYYLLIIGGPEVIPFRFQYELGVNYAVGRVHFDAVDEYRHYAASVVAGEASAARSAPKRITFFAVRNDDDRATKMSKEMLVEPLADSLQKEFPDWQFDRVYETDATKAGLAGCLNSSPALLFTASHGMAYPFGDPNQVRHQGAVLCQEWRGPLKHRGHIDPACYFSGDDVKDIGDLSGTIVFQFACFGAGTPLHDDFPGPGGRPQLAPTPFVARLPQRLMGKPDGGALAVVAHVERAWSYSFMSPEFGPQTETFELCLRTLMSGRRVGFAMDSFAMKHAALAVSLNGELEEVKFGARADDHKLAGLWAAHQDARNYVILGDPAARITT